MLVTVLAWRNSASTMAAVAAPITARISGLPAVPARVMARVCR